MVTCAPRRFLGRLWGVLDGSLVVLACDERKRVPQRLATVLRRPDDPRLERHADLCARPFGELGGINCAHVPPLSELAAEIGTFDPHPLAFAVRDLETKPHRAFGDCDHGLRLPEIGEDGQRKPRVLWNTSRVTPVAR